MMPAAMRTATAVDELGWKRWALAAWDAAATRAAALAAGVWAATSGELAAAGLAVTAAAATALAVRRPELLLAAWFALTPWGSYALRYPEERSVVTFDRVVLVATIVGLLAREAARRGRLPALT